MKLLVTGRKGQVALSLQERARALGVEVAVVGRPEFDLTKPEAFSTVITHHRPDVIVSAAAYTAVDKAESEPELAERINGEAPGCLARAAALKCVPIIHISTDYVFDGNGDRAWRESDPTAPLGAYGRSKLQGEIAVAEAQPFHVILRTAWVYSPFGNNFVKTMLRLAQTRDEIGVVSDQVGNPTSALDIADAVFRVASNLIENPSRERTGVFHLAGTGSTSWAGLAEEIFTCAREFGYPSASVKPISTLEFPTPAKRPVNSKLDCTRLARNHGVVMPMWQSSIRRVVERLGASPSLMI